MGYRNEIHSVEKEEGPPAASYCVPAKPGDWTARGWMAFEGIKFSENRATKLNPADSSITGLCYTFQNCFVGEYEKIMLRIDWWRYDQFGEVTDLPVTEMIFDARQMAKPASALQSIRIMARPLRLSEKVCARSMNAALFLINQINAGQVPDYERILELYRVHPDQNRKAESKSGEYRVTAQAVPLDQQRTPDNKSVTGTSVTGAASGRFQGE